MNQQPTTSKSTNKNNDSKAASCASGISSYDELSVVTPVSFLEPRHGESIVGTPIPQDERDNWRSKERMKTVSVALVMCLNLGVDPPDVVKPNPCARLECWVDSSAENHQKTTNEIGENLKKQYERWQPRARYKTHLNPTVDEVKKLCMSLRRNAKDERVLLHYNGHGVPKPTENGEIWVFNKNFTQYIPLSIYDLQSWMGSPSVYVYDCHSAGLVVKSFERFADDQEKDWKTKLEFAQLGNNNYTDVAASYRLPKPPSYKNCIQLAACEHGQTLPMSPELPADLFTCCLTTPIKTSVLMYMVQNQLTSDLPPPLEIVNRIPGVSSDRKTPFGELNWIFTAVTDTIAWNTLPRDLFQKLFRQDMLVASLFRNFLLADRVMRIYKCTPVSRPKLPSTHDHPLWGSWDYALDLCVNQLKEAFAKQHGGPHRSLTLDIYSPSYKPQPLTITNYVFSPFFVDQLVAFQVWLKYGYKHRSPPQQLPVVLQVLLSQQHRERALELLCCFLDLGPWAVRLALSVGIFPYVLKLLQTTARELWALLAFIWAKLLAVDPQCQHELVKDDGHLFFVRICTDKQTSFHEKLVPAFVIAALVDNHRSGQEALQQCNYVSTAVDLLNDSSCRMLTLWLLIGLARLWTDFNEMRWMAIRMTAHERVKDFICDEDAKVRAAAVHALGSLMSNRSEDNEHATEVDRSICMHLVNTCITDGSPLVRRELVVALHWLVLDFEDLFVTLAYQVMEEVDNILKQDNSQHADEADDVFTTYPISINPVASVVSLRAERHGSPAADSAMGNLVSGSRHSATVAHLANERKISAPAAMISSNNRRLLGASHHSNLSKITESPNNNAHPSTSTTWSEAIRRSSSTVLFARFGAAPQQSTEHDTRRDSLSIINAEQERRAQEHEKSMRFICSIDVLEQRMRNNSTVNLGVFGNIYTSVWLCILRLANDPVPDVAHLANKVLDYIHTRMMLIDPQPPTAAPAQQPAPSRARTTRHMSPDDLALQINKLSHQQSLSSTPTNVVAPAGLLQQQQHLLTHQQQKQSPQQLQQQILSQQQQQQAINTKAKFMVGSPTDGVTTQSPNFATASTTPTSTASLMQQQQPQSSSPQQPQQQQPQQQQQQAILHPAASRNRSSSGKSSIPPPKLTPVLSPYAARYGKRRGIWDQGPVGDANGSYAAVPMPNDQASLRQRQPGGSTSSANGQCHKRSMPLVETEFVAWCSGWFAQPCWKHVRPDRTAKQMSPTRYDQLYNEVPPTSTCKVPSSSSLRGATSDAIRCTCGHSEKKPKHVQEGVSGVVDAMRRLKAVQNKRIESLDEQQFFDNVSHGATAVTLLPIQSYVCVADNRNHLLFWNWHRAKSLGSFSNTRCGSVLVNNQTSLTYNAGEQISYLDTINPVHDTLLLTGTQAGTVRIWDCALATHDHETTSVALTTPRLVSALRVLTEYPRLGAADEHRTVYHWQQLESSLLIGGDVPVIRLWDATSEQKRCDMTFEARQKMQRPAVCTSLDGDIRASHIIVAGGSDGTVRVFDPRLPSDAARVASLRHLEPDRIVSVDSSKCGQSLVAGASRRGDVCIWDPRKYTEPIHHFNACRKLPGVSLRSMSVLWDCGIVASTITNGVLLHDIRGHRKALMQYHQALAAQALGDCTCLKWHPYTMNLAVGGADHVSVYGPNVMAEAIQL